MELLNVVDKGISSIEFCEDGSIIFNDLGSSRLNMKIGIFNIYSTARAVFIGSIFTENVPQDGEIITIGDKDYIVQGETYINGKFGLYVKAII